MRHPRLLRLTGLACVALLVGCAGNAPLPVSKRPRVVVLPFENVAGGSEAARVITRFCQTELATYSSIALVPPGDVEDALVRLRIRIPVLMTAAERDSLQAAVGADYAVTGSVLSFGEVTHPYAGRVGVVSITMQLMDLRSGRVIWSKVDSRQGTDGQWLFGLGVQRDPAVMANAMCRTMLGQIPWARLER